jgi:hypothetical protein
MSKSGIDFGPAYTSEGANDASIIAGDRYSFVGVYLGVTAGQGYLTASEATDFANQGLSIVSLYEGSQNHEGIVTPSDPSYFTPAQADADAAAAISAALTVGQPLGTAIYFSIDYDPTPSGDFSGIISYFERLRADFNSLSFVGAISGVLAADPYKIGIYGPGDALSKLVADPAVNPDYTWLDFAANGFTGENIHRIQNNDTSEGPNTIIFDHDLDSARTSDFGQWGISAWSSAVDGDFGTASNWNLGFVPTTVIDASIEAAGTYTVTSSVDQSVNSLTTAKGVTLAVTAGTFTITNGTGTGKNAGTISLTNDPTLQIGGTFENTGSINLGSTGDPTYLVIAGNVSLTGAGDVILSDSSNNFIASNGSAATLTNTANTISGAGSIGDGDGTLTLNNQKTIDATSTNNALLIDTGYAVTNSGKLEVTGAGGLTIEDTIDNSAMGSVDAAASGSVVDLADGGNISDGKVDIVAGATLEATGTANAISGATVTDKGTLKAIRGTILTLANTTVNAAGGVVEAADAILIPSQIALNSATINNGTLTTEGGIIDTIAGTNSTLNGVTISKPDHAV